MTISFYQDKNVVFLFYRKQFKGKKISLKYFPGITLPEGNKVENNRTTNNELNIKLLKIEIAVTELEDEIDLATINSKAFSLLIDSKLHGKSATTNFFKYAEIFYEETKDSIGARRSKAIQTAINKIKEFNQNITFKDIDKKFYLDFVKWMNKKSYSKNYTGSIIKDLKRILNYATDAGVNTNLTYKDFDKQSEDVYNIYLSEKEIELICRLEITIDLLKLYHADKEKKSGYKKYHLSDESLRRQVVSLSTAKNLFIIGCWTGLRVENYISIDPNIQLDLENGFIHAIANKNGPKLKIPIHRMVNDIIQTNGFPKPISQQKLNEHIKIIGELAGIDETIIYTRTIGGKRKQFIKKKYEMITTHTARRSFASNMEIRGIPRQYTMAITGHKTERNFLKYIQAVQKDILTEKMKEFDVWS